MAARYSGEVAGFKVAAGIGYTVMNDENTSFAVPAAHKDSEFFQAGAYVQHIATGLFLHGIYGNENNNDTALTSGRLEPNSNQYYVKAGIRRKVLPFGATIVYGDYARYNDQLGPDAINMGATGSVLERFGGGIAQELDAAAMTVYLKYQHYQADIDGIAALEEPGRRRLRELRRPHQLLRRYEMMTAASLVYGEAAVAIRGRDRSERRRAALPLFPRPAAEPPAGTSRSWCPALSLAPMSSAKLACPLATAPQI